MKIRSYMVVTDLEMNRFTLYVLVEGRVNNCVVYIRRWPMKNGPFGSFVTENQLIETMATGQKVLKKDSRFLPFKIPSDLTYDF